MAGNGLDERALIQDYLRKIDARTTEHSEVIRALARPLETIATNTGIMSSDLQELKVEGREHLNLIAGKNQVPLLVFLIVVAALSIAFIMTIAYFTKTQVNLSPDQFHVGQHDGQ